jgi:hypothetical protein
MLIRIRNVCNLVYFGSASSWNTNIDDEQELFRVDPGVYVTEVSWIIRVPRSCCNGVSFAVWCSGALVITPLYSWELEGWKKKFMLSCQYRPNAMKAVAVPDSRRPQVASDDNRTISSQDSA